MSRAFSITASLLFASFLAGCDMMGDSAEKQAAAKEAEGRAIGSACRHAARAIEDCYAMNKKADKASVFAGWRDMNDYMRENKIEPVAPQVSGGGGTARAAKPDKAEKSDKPEKGDAKPAALSASTGTAPEATETTVQIEKKPAKATPKPRAEHD